MNKKILIISLCIILLIAIGSSIVFANLNSKDTPAYNSDDIISIDDSYIKVNTGNMKNAKDITNITNGKNTIQLADTYLTTFKLTDKKIDVENSTVEVYRNNLDSITETVISNPDMIITLNSETGELTSYINNKTNFEKNTLSKASIKSKALEILSNIANSDEYKLIMLEQFDEEIYRAKFAKTYGEYVNPGELISFSFAPQTSEIVTFAQKSVPFASNEIKLSEEDARKIAQEYLDKSTATEISSVSLEIVMPNSGLNKVLNAGEVYKNPNQTRLAYICSFNNVDQTKIYIDCSTGSTIGSEVILGGDF